MFAIRVVYVLYTVAQATPYTAAFTLQNLRKGWG